MPAWAWLVSRHLGTFAASASLPSLSSQPPLLHRSQPPLIHMQALITLLHTCCAADGLLGPRFAGHAMLMWGFLPRHLGITLD